MKNKSEKLTLLKKGFGSDFSIFWPDFCICISHHLQNYDHSTTNKDIGLKYRSKIFRKRVKLIFRHRNHLACLFFHY